MLVFLSKSVLVSKLGCFNLAVKFSAVNLLNSGVVIYLSRLRILFSTQLISVFRTAVVPKTLVLEILF